jgi:hypothetical protein
VQTAVLAALIVLVPAMAQATFSSRTSSAVAVGTLRLAAPGSVAGTSGCISNWGAAFVVDSFAEVPGATSYLLTLAAPRGGSVSKRVTAGTAPVTLSSWFRGPGVYTLTIRAEVAGWWGPQLTRTFTC